MGSHYYNKGQFKLPSVTTIISDCNDKSGALTNWAAAQACEWIKVNCEFVKDDGMDYWRVDDVDLNTAKVNYRSVSDKALEIGSQTHSAIEHWLQTGKEPHSPLPEVTNAFLAFLEFFDAHKMKTMEIEFSVYGDYWGGTLDWLGEYDQKMYVWDWKTSKYHYPNEHGPQIAAYRSAIKTKVEGCGVLRIDKETGYPDPKDYSKRYIKDLEHFNLMVPLYLHRHPRIAKTAGYNPPF